MRIQLQFRDESGRVTRVTFFKKGVIKVIDRDHNNNVVCSRQYTKDSPITAMYQHMLTDARKIEENLYQVIGAW